MPLSTRMSNPDLYKQLDQSEWLWTPPGAARKRFDPHEFAGYGSYNVRTTPCHDEMGQIDEALENVERSKVLLKELEATAISGNDILSSTFYVSGLVTLSAGPLAPLCLTLVGVVLYLFQGIYHETVMALPCNGGTYNILLNCTSKQVASMAAVFAIIAYITTGVVSALEAVAYLETVLPASVTVDTTWATIGLLFFFCLLTNVGIQESATFAKYIFCLHVGTLSVLTFFGLLFMCFHAGLTLENWSAPYPPVDVAGDILPGTFWTALFYGFSSAMLGVSGFETSSQFVEEQAPGVFPKTLRNMWVGVMFFNPILSLISFSALDIEEIYEHHNTVLARTAHVVGHWIQTQLSFPEHFVLGPAFSVLVSIDAFIVLAAALLTGYVGINGLIRRLAMDRCLPQIFLHQNPWTGTDSFILVGFFLLCASQVVVLDCNVEALGGVYCYAFLTVMTIFAVGNIILKIKRPSLPREISVSWLHSVIGLVSVVIALLGNVLGKPQLLTFFFVYFLIVGMLVLLMFQRVRIMKLLYKLLKPSSSKQEEEKEAKQELVINATDMDDYVVGEEEALIPPPPPSPPQENEPQLMVDKKDSRRPHRRVSALLGQGGVSSCLTVLSSALKEVQDVPFVFFCKHDDLYMLNKAVLYIKSNEQTNKIIIVHCISGVSTNVDLLTEHVKLVDLLYPQVKVSLLVINNSFCASTVEWLSRALDVPINAMFISCPDQNFAMKVAQLRGMRIIASND